MSGDKTEEPTAKKLRDARKRGEIPKSTDILSASVLLVFLASAGGAASAILASLVAMFRQSLEGATRDAYFLPSASLEQAAGLGLGAIAPVLIAMMVGAVAVSFVQTKGVFSLTPITPDLSKLDPIKGIKNLFTQRRLIEFLKNLLKLCVVSYVALGTMEESLAVIALSVGRPSAEIAPIAGTLLSDVFWQVGGAILAIGVLDVLYQSWRFRQDQKMSKEEVKREYKESEGDPHAKQQRQRMHRELSEHNAVQSVRDADVLVVNPTHLAIALRYDEDEHEVPEVIARGQDHLAKRMIQAAEEEGIPVMRDVELARSLFVLELGESVPEPLFDAVAAVLQAAWTAREEAEREEEQRLANQRSY